MQKFSPLAYIRKFQIFIIIGALIAGVMFYEYLAGKQTYTVSAIIEYTNARASEGYSPDGREIDTSEIYSVSVMQDVFERMGLDYDSYNLDQFRSRVIVTPILSEEEKAMQEAQNNTGEESTVKATKYMVSFTASREDSDQPANFARQVLDNMLDAFLADYAENHIGGGTIVSNLSGLYDGNYDYLEMIEIIDEDVQNTLELLYNRVMSMQNSALYYYRSTMTGYTFMDIYREFDIIYQIEVPNIYAYILNNRVSRDRNILISKYQKRIEDYQISNNANLEQSQAITHIIDAYVQMMRESGNTDITYEYILNDVDDDYYRYLQQDEDGSTGTKWERPDETVKYDVLLEDYVKNSTNVEYDKINIDYCQYIIDVFSGIVSASSENSAVDGGAGEDTAINGGAGEDAAAAGRDAGAFVEDMLAAGGDVGASVEDMLAAGGDVGASVKDMLADDGVSVEEAAVSGEEMQTTQQIIISEADADAATEEMLDNVISRLNELYRLLDRTLMEYNEYAGAANISLGSNVVLQPGRQLMLYSGIVVIVCAVMLSIAVIVLSRIGEIFHYHVYMDHKFQIPNRSACDSYMESYSNHILPENISCIAIMANDVRQKNEQYGVEACDEMLRKLVDILQAAFASAGDSFISVNGLGQFIVFVKNTSYGQAEACMRYAAGMAANYNEDAECKISYQYGIAESKNDSLYQIKALLMKAIEKCSNARPGEDTVSETQSEKDQDNESYEVSGKNKVLDDLLKRLEMARSG